MKKLYLFTCIAVVALYSCMKQEFESGKSDFEFDKSQIVRPEEAFPNREKEVVTLKSGMTVYKLDSLYILDSDIMLSEEQVNILDNSPTRSAMLNNFAKYWSDGKVYFTYSSDFSNKVNVEAAFREWEAKTGIRFYQRTNQSDYIYFENSDDMNSSFLGRKGGRQSLFLAKTQSSAGTAMHEIGHAVGLFHEQMRSDRDNYITIVWSNIDSDKRPNFDKYTVNYTGCDVGEFDFSSVMLYDSWAFSKNENPTMTKKDGSVFITQRAYLSNGDVNGVRLIYGPPYARIVNTILADEIDWYGNSYREWYSGILFYADKECTQRVTLESPRLVYVRYTYFYEDRTSPPHTSTSYSAILVPAGSDGHNLGLCRDIAEYDYGNVVHRSSEDYSIAFK